ncbi:MAG TPA: hypothetical protein VMS96_07910 [Terriglobales bacterium]|nr:hypothetical protein [Terriglobales bacterium]
MSAELLGKWTSDPTDALGYDKYGDVSLEFLEGGELVYTMNDPHRESTMVMQYRVEGDEIVTAQHTNPREERTKFRIGPDGKLSLTFAGVETRYVRNSEGDTH